MPEAWLSDEDRCREAGIPDTLQFRTKPMIALDLLRRAIGNGVQFKYVTADEVYGRSVGFRRDVASMGLICVVEVLPSQRGWLKRPLDPGISEHERTRRLHKLLEKIHYWQTHNTLAAVSHRKHRCQVLKRLGIDLSKLTKCFERFVAL